MTHAIRSPRPHLLRALPAVACIAAAACTPAGSRTTTAPLPAAGSARIVEGAGGASVSVDTLVRRLARADVVFFGEQHDDAEAHALQARLLAALGTLGRPVVLSLEMFERDVQPVLDDYLAGRIPEPELLARARPWPRYATDYRPMVEIAKERGWPVIAANVPRPFASAIGRQGLAALDSLPPSSRPHAAADIQCPDDAYRTAFLGAMRGHSAGGAASRDTLPTAMAERFYLAQCVKDETMAESIIEATRRHPGAIVLHVNGAFHSDHARGTVSRVRRRNPALALTVLTAVPAADPAAARGEGHEGRADWLVFTLRRP